MKRIRVRCFWVVFVFLLSILNLSCGTTKGKESLSNDIGILEENGGNENVFEMVKEPVLLNVVIRKLGVKYPVSIALLNGVESRWVQIDKPEKSLEQFLSQVISSTGLVYYCDKGYYFLYPSEFVAYRELAEYSFAKMMPWKFKDIKVTAGFGVDTRLYNVLNSLNYTYGCNLVADNTLAELPIGEVVANQLSLDLVLDMVIKSARISPQSLRICAGEDFVFLYTTLNKNSLILEDCKCFEEDGVPERLKRKVTFSVPEIVSKGKTLPFYNSAKPLEDVVSVISAQLGVGVELQAGTEELPINPMYLSNVSVKKVLDLLVYQWLDNKYSYIFDGDKVRFVVKR